MAPNIPDNSSTSLESLAGFKTRVDQVIDEVGTANEEIIGTVDEMLVRLFSNSSFKELLLSIAEKDVFSNEFQFIFKDDTESLGAMKELKYFFNLPLGQFFQRLSILYKKLPTTHRWASINDYVTGGSFNLEELSSKPVGVTKVNDFLRLAAPAIFSSYKNKLENLDPHSLYPTNIYRRCSGYTVTKSDFSVIESVMSTTLTTSIRIKKQVLDVNNDALASIYGHLGRCAAIIDDKVADIYGKAIDTYFAHHGIKLIKMVYAGNEVDKEIGNVERILVDLKASGVSRNEPVLIVGGGVISDIGGFACALYHRSTPYVMLCTSIVSGIDAGPSPRTCCDGFGYKNLYGAYHPPVVTITDRYFFNSLHEGWIRHGIAEIIKMSVTKDYDLFCLLEKVGPSLIRTKFGTTNLDECEAGFEQDCDLIVGKALDSYVKSEYGNLWETHQCRPHAYGHTWSPGYELAAGMLHGHAVATGMGLGAYFSYVEGWIAEEQYNRILKLISDMELALWHPIMDEVDIIYSAQVKMIEKRGGNLCAPVPKGSIGQCGYINEMPKELLKQRLCEYKAVCAKYPRQGFGIEMHCHDVGLEDPSVVAKKHIRNELNASKSD